MTLLWMLVCVLGMLKGKLWKDRSITFNSGYVLLCLLWNCQGSAAVTIPECVEATCGAGA